MNERRREEDNLTSLADLSEKSLLDAISSRYSRDTIYTDVGDILVAVNPFRQLEESYYSEDASKKYAADGSWDKLPPHIYAVAARAFTAMLHSKKNQICVISGESGAGKTESSKLVIQQVLYMPCLMLVQIELWKLWKFIFSLSCLPTVCTWCVRKF